MGQIAFYGFLCFFLGAFLGMIVMCLMNASSKYDEYMNYECFDECAREDNNSFND